MPKIQDDYEESEPFGAKSVHCIVGTVPNDVNLDIFAIMYSALRDDGTMWLRCLDSYARDGSLCGAPWRLALQLQSMGWILRQDLVLRCDTGERVVDRCVMAHQYLFLFSKQMGYFYDAEAIRESSNGTWNSKKGFVDSKKKTAEKLNISASDLDKMRTQFAFNTHHDDVDKSGRNKRSVWDGDWITPAILAGTSAKGCCGECGSPWERLISSSTGVTSDGRCLKCGVKHGKQRVGSDHAGANYSVEYLACVSRESVGWQPTCECNGKLIQRKTVRMGYGAYHNNEKTGVEYGMRQDGKGPASVPGAPTKEIETTITEYESDIELDDHPIVPCVVLDPFGSNEVRRATIKAGRRYG